jgi:hypothetical protein
LAAGEGGRAGPAGFGKNPKKTARAMGIPPFFEWSSPSPPPSFDCLLPFVAFYAMMGEVYDIFARMGPKRVISSGTSFFSQRKSFLNPESKIKSARFLRI